MCLKHEIPVEIEASTMIISAQEAEKCAFIFGHSTHSLLSHCDSAARTFTPSASQTPANRPFSFEMCHAATFIFVSKMSHANCLGKWKANLPQPFFPFFGVTVL